MYNIFNYGGRENYAMIYLIANEKHLTGGERKKLDAVTEIFKRAGKQCEVLTTNKEGDAKAHAERITSSGEKHTLVAMGGDGTLHDIINGFKDFENCCLGLIPLGTGNDFAATARIPLDVKQAAEIIAFREPEYIDFIEFSNGVRSINIAGMGIDVDVLERTYAGKNKGKSKYVKALISSLLHFESRKFIAKFNGEEKEINGLICAVCNGRQMGGGIKVCPSAKLNDGFIELFMCDYLSKSRIIGAFLKLITGRVHKVKEAQTVRVKSAVFIPQQEDYTIQLDGELYKNIPFEVRVVSEKLKFFLPARR